MLDSSRFLTILVDGATFTAAAAALVAAVLMYEITKKFGSGILASGFKTISAGVFLLAIGIIIDAFNGYFLASSNDTLYSIATVLKVLCFVIGTYVIVIGTKKTADKLERLTK